MWLLRIVIVVFVLGIAISVGYAGYAMFVVPSFDRLSATIQKLGFFPVNPPSTLRGPGSIYYFSKDGRSTAILCSVDKKRLENIVQMSSSAGTDFNELTNASFGLAAKLPQSVQSQADVATAQTVTFVLENVRIYEVALDDLAGIVEALQTERPLCARAIQNALEAGDYVCSGQQVLQASAKYTVKKDTKVSGSASGQDARELIKAKIDPNAQETDETTMSGSDLYYGMKVAPTCMSLPGQPLRRLPMTWFEWQLEKYGLRH
jgi:hypothetical protein